MFVPRGHFVFDGQTNRCDGPCWVQAQRDRKAHTFTDFVGPIEDPRRVWFDFELSIGRLNFAECQGRITVYANLTLFGRTLWLQRWDTARSSVHTHRHFGYSRDSKMVWTCGAR